MERINNPELIVSKNGTHLNNQLFAVEHPDLGFRIYDSIHDITDVWSEIAEDNIFFSVEFMQLVEENPPKAYNQKYLIFEKNEVPVGIALLQITHLRLSDNLHYKAAKTSSEKLGNGFKSGFSSLINMDTLICGNVLLTGEYGFHFSDRSYSLKDKYLIIENALDISAKVLRKKGFKIGPILMKDFYQSNSMSMHNVDKTEFSNFIVQPNMMLEMRDWKSFEEYLADLKSKSRVRAKSAFKKIKGVEKKELSISEIEKYNKDLYRLYLGIAKAAGFNLFFLPEDYFVKLKKALGDSVKIVGYFSEGKLISYYTIVISSDHMEAHYLGYDKEYNTKHQLYLNMLFDLIREGIDCQTKLIQFARTALEIKSSVGAVPYEMSCYLKHSTPWKNKLMRKGLNWFAPEEEWTQRSPFKS